MLSILKRRKLKNQRQKTLSSMIRKRDIQMYLDIWYSMFVFFNDLKRSMGMVTMYQDIVKETNYWCLKRIKTRQDLYKLHKLFVEKKGF